MAHPYNLQYNPMNYCVLFIFIPLYYLRHYYEYLVLHFVLQFVLHFVLQFVLHFVLQFVSQFTSITDIITQV